MKKVLILLICIMMIFSCNAFALPYGSEWNNYSQSATVNYSDVSWEHWAYDAIVRTTEKNWFSGYPDGTFRPNGSITRAEALKVFVVFLGLDYKNIQLSETSFYDVDVNEWYAPYIEAGKDLFPVHTTIQGKTPFNPNMPVTREDTIYALVKALGCDIGVKYPDQSVLNMFKDKSSISAEIKNYFAIALEHELVSGFPDGTIRAQAALTRAEFATLLMRGTEHGFCGDGKREAKIESVNVYPASPIEMEIGETVTLSARAIYTDGTNKDYTSFEAYNADSNGVVEVRGKSVSALKEGYATIKFNDSYLKNISISINVKKPTDAPKIKISDYPDTTEEKSVIISGTITDKTGTEIDLTCNLRDLNVENGKFSYTANIVTGENIFEFTAINGYGNKSSKIIKIYGKETKPSKVKMPNVVGKRQNEAKEIIENLGLEVEIKNIWDENAIQGVVVEQSVGVNEEVEIGRTVVITVSGGKNDWVGWSDSLPSYVNESSYIIEEKTQYRFRKLEISTSSSSTKNGWELYNKEESWGRWSDWSRNAVSSSSTREVNTKNVEDPKQYKTQWHYTRYYGWNPSKNSYVSWPWEGTYSKTYQESGWRDAPLENRGRADNVDATCYKDTSDQISVWWWNETTRQVALPATYHTEYQYRDKNVTYYFRRWNDWTNWSDNVVSANNETEVETKTVYRYKFK